MGENRVKGEGILGKLFGEEASCSKNCHLAITQNITHLKNFNLDFNKFKFGSIHIIASMIKTMNGEKKYA